MTKKNANQKSTYRNCFWCYMHDPYRIYSKLNNQLSLERHRILYFRWGTILIEIHRCIFVCFFFLLNFGGGKIIDYLRRHNIQGLTWRVHDLHQPNRTWYIRIDPIRYSIRSLIFMRFNKTFSNAFFYCFRFLFPFNSISIIFYLI